METEYKIETLSIDQCQGLLASTDDRRDSNDIDWDWYKDSPSMWRHFVREAWKEYKISDEDILSI